MLYSTKDKQRQLKELCRSLGELIDELERGNRYQDALRDYKVAKSLADVYLAQGFQQADLNELTANIPDVCYRHKEWVPPLEPGHEAEYPYIVASWFEKIDQKYSKVKKAATLVRAIGEY